MSAAVIVVLSGCTGCSAKEQEENSPVQETEYSSSQEVAEPSAQVVFEARDMEGNAVSSDIFSESRLTMVNVWATYCNPCLREMPGLGELAGEYDSETFQIIGVISDVPEGSDKETLEYVSELIGQTKADYTHVLLNESLYYALLTDVSAVPTTFFIDQNGEIVDTVMGAAEKEVWEELIDALLETQ